MSLKKWLNDHNLGVSATGVSTLVALLYLCSTGLYLSLNFPYLVLENRFQDWVAQRGKSAPKDPRVYFLADDAPSHTLDQLWDEDFAASPILKRMKQPPPWPRDVFAAILDRLENAGARVVGFDYMLKGEKPEDSTLRASLDKWRDRVVLGSQIDDVVRGISKAPQISPPPPSLVGNAADPRLGFVNMFPDLDGVTRRFKFQTTLLELADLKPHPDDHVFESLAVRMAGQAGFGQLVPKSRESHLIRFAYKGDTLRLEQGRSQSIADIFVPSLWEANYQSGEFFRDKIVLIGPHGSYHKDVLDSPFGIIAGPEFHLNALNAILTGSFLHESPFWVDLLLIGIGGLLAVLIGRLMRNPLLRLTALITLCLFCFFGAVLAFDHLNLVIPVFSPLVALVGSSFTSIVWQQLIEVLERARLRKTFERYVSRDVVKELLDNPQSYLNSLVGQRKRVTVLFSDVRGFTTITESGDAQTLVKQLNEYFAHMVEIVFANHGTLDKFIGDAVMAQWGGIYSQGEKVDAVHAVRTAVQMRNRLAELNARWIPNGMLEIKFGIGINHGEAIVGNLGCEAKMEVTLIGDAVNTASRFEGLTKEYHTDLIIGKDVAGFVRDVFHLRTAGLNQPKGKTVPLELFTVLDERSAGPEPAWLADHEEGVRLFRQREFTAAAGKFEKVLAALPEDWLASDYLEDCRGFEKTPPPPDWNAVRVMKTK